MQEITFINKILGLGSWAIVALFLIWMAYKLVDKFIDVWAKKNPLPAIPSNGNGNGKKDSEIKTLNPEQVKALFMANCEINQKKYQEETDKKIDKIDSSINRFVEYHEGVTAVTHSRIDQIFTLLAEKKK